MSWKEDYCRQLTVDNDFFEHTYWKFTSKYFILPSSVDYLPWQEDLVFVFFERIDTDFSKIPWISYKVTAVSQPKKDKEIDEFRKDLCQWSFMVPFLIWRQ